MKIAIIGAGNLGQCLAKGLIISNIITKLYLTKRNTCSLSEWKELSNTVITSNNSEAVKKSDIIIICVQPNQYKEISIEIKGFLNKKHTIISTITGLSIESIEKSLGANINIIRSMPNTPISVGKSVTCLCSNNLGKSKLLLAEAIFNSLGRTFIIEEKNMEAATVICASGIAFWMRLIRSTAQGAVQLGFETKQALEMCISTALGAITLLNDNNTHPEQEIDKVTTPSGCTIKGLIEMEHHGLSSALISGLVASFEKINNISINKK